MLSKSSKSKVTTNASKIPLPILNNKTRLFSPIVSLKMPISSRKLHKKLFDSNKTELLKAKPSRINFIKVHT